jgi:hypothetical protein
MYRYDISMLDARIHPSEDAIAFFGRIYLFVADLLTACFSAAVREP